jgi:hypothetical protein
MKEGALSCGLWVLHAGAGAAQALALLQLHLEGGIACELVVCLLLCLVRMGSSTHAACWI